MTEGFGPKAQGFDHFVFGNHKSLKKITKNTAAIMVEPIMGMWYKSNSRLVLKRTKKVM